MSIVPHPRAVVTGAGSGLGRAFCIELASRGARLIVSDLNLADAEATAKACGASAHAVACDVSKLADVEALAREADRLIGGVDLVINNAGVAAAGQVGAIPIADWQWTLGVNLWGVIHGCHVFAPRLREQRSGHILNVASAAGLISAPEMGPYNVSKAAVVALSETLRGELAEAQVGVSVLCPTFFRTNIGNAARGPIDDKQRALMDKMMDSSKLDAAGVARVALDQSAAGTLYILPHADGRWAWRMKRLSPERFASLMPKVMAMQAKKLGLD